MARFASSILFIYMLFLSVPCWSGEVSISATVDRNVLEAGEYVILNIRVLNSGEEPDMDVVKDFNIRNRGTSSNTQWVNGRTTRIHDYQFALVPKKEGRSLIPSFTIEEDGRVYVTKPIEIMVQKSGSGAVGIAPKNCFLQNAVSSDRIYMASRSSVRYVFSTGHSFSSPITRSLPQRAFCPPAWMRRHTPPAKTA